MGNRMSEWLGEADPPLGQVVTQWSQVVKARGADAEGKAALRRLSERYYGPVFRTLRCSGLPRDPAMEMTQRFMVLFCEGKFVHLADPGRGSFRAFLKTSLKNFMHDEREKEARRRGLPLETVDPADNEPGQEKVFDREMAWATLDDALEAARKRLTSEPGAWEALRRFDLEPAQGAERSHEDLAAEFGMELARFRRGLYRARAVFKEEVCRLLRDGLEQGQSLDAELGWFLQTLAGGRE